MNRYLALLEEAKKEAVLAREIASKAESEKREMTADEWSEFRKHMDLAVKAKADADAAKKDADVIAQAKSLAEEIGLALPTDAEKAAVVAEDKGTAQPGLPLSQQVLKSAQFKSLLTQFPGGHIPDGMHVNSDPIRVKSLISGSSVTSAGAFITPEDSGIVELLGRRPLTIRDAIARRRTGSDAVSYVRQTAHTNAAAPVAEATTAAMPTAPEGGGALVPATGGGYKPEGSWTFEKVTAPVITIAEWVPITRQALADVASLEGLIDQELIADVQETEETQVVSGDGTGENLTGILNTSGTQSQAFDTDIFISVRKAITKVRQVGRTVPTGVALSPTDVEKVDIAKTNSGQYYSGGPFVSGPRTLWGYPILESEAIPEGTAVVGDWSKAVLWDREQSQVRFSDQHADFFIRNLVALLAEERVAFGVTRPQAFVITAVAASA
jgi:HK97 family phage major capsid protein